MSDSNRREFVGFAAGVVPTVVLGSAVAAEARGEAPVRKVVGPSVSPAFSRAIVFDNIVHVAGVLGTKAGLRELASPDFEGQCRQGLENLKASVEAAGAKMENVLKCGCFLTDAADFAAMNKIYVEFFPKDPPARSTVVVKELVLAGAQFEIDCIAALI